MHHEIRLGVTGLRRTGKTVFLTSLVYQLEQLGSEGLDAFANRGVTIWPAKIVGGGSSLPPFPYKEMLGRLRSPETPWPAPTDTESELVLEFTFQANPYPRRLGKILRWPLGVAKDRGTVRLILHDYPGEFLLDAPLIKQTYSAWSATAYDRMCGQCPEAAVAYGEQANRTLLTDGAAEHDSLAAPLRELRNAYGRFIAIARTAGMEMLQPGIALASLASLAQPAEQITDWHEGLLPFVPLPPSVPDDHAAKFELAKRYDAYCKLRVQPFLNRVGTSSRQIVLVDVLRVLRNGVDCYNDTQRCLASIMEAYRYNGVGRQFARNLPPGLRPAERVGRVIFAATKADQALKSHRGNLVRLLETLVRKAQARCATGVGPVRHEWFTSLRATADRQGQWNGRPAEALFGKLVGEDTATDRNPGTVPSDWPSGADTDPWPFGSEQYKFPDFSPPSLPPRDGVPWPHLNLDCLLWQVLADCFHVS